MTARTFACELPQRMRTLPRDPRGYPIPFVVFRDAKGRPHFTVNDSRRVGKAVRQKLCGMCGRRMCADEGYWFVGGPGSALHPGGRYIDGPAHEDCARFAIRVCPYLAAPRYGRRINAGTVDPAALGGTLIAFDPSMDDRRPALFCLARTSRYDLEPGDGTQPYFAPRRPWEALEYWRHGQQLAPEVGEPIARGAVAALLETGRGVSAAPPLLASRAGPKLTTQPEQGETR